MIAECKNYNQAHRRTLEALDIHLSHLISGSISTFFSAISMDIIPITLTGVRSNHTKAHYVLAILYMLSHSLEFYLMDNMREETIMLKLFMLQQSWNPISHIITDPGSNLRHLEIQGIKNSIGKAYRILAILLLSADAAANNQRSNTVEAHIKNLSS